MRGKRVIPIVIVLCTFVMCNKSENKEKVNPKEIVYYFEVKNRFSENGPDVEFQEVEIISIKNENATIKTKDGKIKNVPLLQLSYIDKGNWIKITDEKYNKNFKGAGFDFYTLPPNNNDIDLSRRMYVVISHKEEEDSNYTYPHKEGTKLNIDNS
ncbi:MAG TPA: hypothetical protein PKK43_13505, partial [Spirochaetota bacterium]|nr:hypothetical protein [Spirochaetota bacterium]